MADVIKFRCKGCEKKISVRAEYAGKKAKCPGCKQPLRVPTPRPKRSSTGVPIAAGADDSGSSSAGAKSYSLDDLAAMEANAQAEIKELSSKAMSQPASMRIEGGKDCPGCGASSKQEAVICVYCGHNFESGKKLKTKKDTAIKKAVSSFGERTSAAGGGREHEPISTRDILRYFVPMGLFLIASIACYTGAVEAIVDMDTDNKRLGGFIGIYESFGPIGAGTINLGLALLSFGLWQVKKRWLSWL